MDWKESSRMDWRKGQIYKTSRWDMNEESSFQAGDAAVCRGKGTFNIIFESRSERRWANWNDFRSRTNVKTLKGE